MAVWSSTFQKVDDLVEIQRWQNRRLARERERGGKTGRLTRDLWLTTLYWGSGKGNKRGKGELTDTSPSLSLAWALSHSLVWKPQIKARHRTCQQTSTSLITTSRTCTKNACILTYALRGNRNTSIDKKHLPHATAIPYEIIHKPGNNRSFQTTSYNARKPATTIANAEDLRKGP